MESMPSSSSIQLALFSYTGINVGISEQARIRATAVNSSSFLSTTGISAQGSRDSAEKRTTCEKPLPNPNLNLKLQRLIHEIPALPGNDSACEIVQIMNNEVDDLTVSDFNYLLLALLAQSESELAFQLFSHLLKHGLRLDARSHSIMIRCHCRRNKLEDGKRTLDRMMEKGHHSDFETLGILVASLCEKGRLERALEVFDAMKRMGFGPTIHTYNCWLRGLCYMGRVEEAYETLMKMKRSSESNIYSYTVVMDGLCKVGRSDEARELLFEAMENGFAPTTVTYNTLLSGYNREGRPRQGFSVLRLMKKKKCIPDQITYITFLDGLLKWGEIRAALAAFEEMEAAGSRLEDQVLDRLFRAICIRSLTETNLVETAQQLFVKMTKSGFSIQDGSTCGLYIRSLCIGGKLDEALSTFNQTVKAGFVPRTITFNNLIQTLCKKHRVEDALVVFVCMKEHGKIPSRTSYDALIKRLNEERRSLYACNVFGAALKQRVFPHKKPRYIMHI